MLVKLGMNIIKESLYFSSNTVVRVLYVLCVQETQWQIRSGPAYEDDGRHARESWNRSAEWGADWALTGQQTNKQKLHGLLCSSVADSHTVQHSCAEIIHTGTTFKSKTGPKLENTSKILSVIDKLTITFSHWSDAFIQSDLKVRNIHTRSNLGFSVSHKETLTCRARNTHLPSLPWLKTRKSCNYSHLRSFKQQKCLTLTIN